MRYSMRRRALLTVPALLGAALVVPTHAGAASAAAPLASAGQTHHATASYAAARKRKPRVLHLPAKPVITGIPLTNGARVSWGTTHNATRYRVKWSFAPWNYWPSAARYSGWLPMATR